MGGHQKSRLGAREKKKLATRDRIRAAARELFAKRGYAAATMRQIAGRAHVGLGTLFNYAEDKRDLVFLIFNEELNATTDVALAAPRSRAAPLDQLMAVFRAHYQWLATQPELSRILLQELTFYSSGKQAATFHAIRKRLIDGVEQLILNAQKSRKLRADIPASLIARHIFFVYSASLRWWIASPRPDPRRGVEDLRRLLKLQFEGLRPQ